MSRGPSPAFSVPEASTSSSSSSLNRANLRVDTDPQHSISRLRSKSNAQTTPREPPLPNHQASRSYSHTASPSDVSLAVDGLRDVDGASPVEHRSGLERSDESVYPATVQRIHEALARSGDGGDTLDLSRRAIGGIGVDAVELLRKGVGKDHKGVWR